jgi:hypothetical protein
LSATYVEAKAFANAILAAQRTGRMDEDEIARVTGMSVAGIRVLRTP